MASNVILIFGDQWRAQAFGYAGNTCVQTPHIDRLASQSINATNAVSGCSVCCPARASLLTGQYPLTHGVFVNDVHLSDRAVSLAQAFKNAGYDTAYVGKWHVNANGRSNYIPPENRQGFDYWKVLECTHNYNNSFYYANDSDEKLTWEGYDAIAQTRDVQEYVENYDSENPFLLVLSWGPPHAPYETAPEKYRAMYRPEDVPLRENVPPESEASAREWIAGYYAHCTALDDCMGDLLQTLDDKGIADDTLLLFFSDHGDMLGSQGVRKSNSPGRSLFAFRFCCDGRRNLDRRVARFLILLIFPILCLRFWGFARLMFPIRLRGWIFRIILWEVRIHLMVPRFYNVRSPLGSGRAIGARVSIAACGRGNTRMFARLMGRGCSMITKPIPFS